jgi:rod shape-determining protein MreC
LTARTTLWFFGMFTTAALFIALSGVGVLGPLEDISYAAVSPIRSLLTAIATPIANLVTNFGDIRSLTTENERLRTENERLASQVARLQEDTARLGDLERLLDVKQALADQTFLTGRVVASEPNNLRQVIAIDRGKSDGIKIGMPVLTEGKALVGTVTKVDSNHAWITLVTDIDSAVSGVDLESQAPGVVSGGYNRQLTMEFVAATSSIKEGDTVVSSGLGGSYPAGLVIGRVTGVTGKPQEVFRKVAVEPLASLSHLDNVLVMTSFMPTRVPLP